MVLQSREELIGSIEKEFEAKYLTKENLNAFEERAKEKFMDFTDYLGIYTNKKYDEAFRNQAGNMISNLFTNGMNTETNLISSRKESKYNLHDFLTDIDKMEYDFIKLNVDHVRTSPSLTLLKDGTYKGAIAFSGEILGITSRDTVTVSSGLRNVEIIVSRSAKHFGNDSLTIWGVHFGDIQ